MISRGFGKIPVTNCTVTGPYNGSSGLPSNGGTGISVSSGLTGTVIIQSCNISSNSAVYSSGGGLSVSVNGPVAVSGNTFIGNTGSGAQCYGSTVTFSSNTFLKNNCYMVASCSGAFICQFGAGAGATGYGTTIVFSGNNFTGNTVGGAVGGDFTGVGAYGSGTTVNFTGNTFSGNSGIGGSDGGGACGTGGNVTFSGNTFSGNSVSGHGGGVFCYGTGTFTLTNNTFVVNSDRKSTRLNSSH